MKDATNHADGRGYRRGTRLRRAGSAHVLREEAYMFFLTYLRHELRRRMRQAILIAVGLGLVVTVTAASAGVENAQSTVLHALYGIGTDITVTKAPPPGSHAGGAFSPGSAAQQVDELLNGQLGLLDASSVASISRLRYVATAAGGLTLTDMKLTIPSAGSLGPGGQPPSSLPAPTSFTVDGVDLTHLGLGPLGSGEISAGQIFAASDGGSNVAVVDSNYAMANKLTVSSTIAIAKTRFTVIGIVRKPQGGGEKRRNKLAPLPSNGS
jgi:putative ABC transport system permease protein